MEKTKNRIIFVLMALALVVMAFLFPAFSSGAAYADTEQDPSVLQDLHKDEKFDESVYPVVGDDYSLKVIQIAESVDNELFVYVYQPCSPNVELWATEINISTNTEHPNPTLYDLSLISVSGVFYKYRVEGLVVDQRVVRYYDIISILRAWNRKYDEQPDEGQTVNEVAYAVGDSWAAMTHDGTVIYSCTSVETITITDKYVGFVRYENGFILFHSACDSYYVAFSTDKEIEKLMEADVEYLSRTYTIMYTLSGQQNINYSEYKENQKTLTYTDRAQTDFRRGSNYTWNRIESAKDFIANENLTVEAKQNLENKEWVLRFDEPVYGNVYGGSTSYRDVTEISEVTILRLKFETEGVTYDLGVVDTKQTGSETPDNVQPKTFWEKIEDFWNTLKLVYKILIIIGLVIAGVLVLGIVIRILKFLWDFVSEPFKKRGRR